MAKKHKIQKALTKLVQQITRFVQKLTSEDRYRLLRTALVSSDRQRQAGFVLPTTALLIIVMLLVVSALIFRSYQRSTDAINQYASVRVENAATPAIERAKAKLELVFKDRAVTDIAEGSLEASLLDPAFNFGDETRLQTLPGIQGNAKPIAWTFETDTDGDGANDAVTAYAIVMRTTAGDGGSRKTMDPELATSAELLRTDEEKANHLLVRNGPLLENGRDTTAEAQACQVTLDDGGNGEFGWFPISTAIYRKNFQVYAITVPKEVVNGNSGNPVISTVQYQQDRTFEGFNKWGAWFRSDLEATPGFPFNWNGAIHSEGSIFIRPEQPFRLHLISSPESCFYQPELNSDVSTLGHLVYGALADGRTGPFNLDLYPDGASTVVDTTNDSVDYNSGNLIDIALDPLAIIQNNASIPRNNAVDIDGIQAANWAESNLAQRVKRVAKDADDRQPPPYVDDTYRADNLYGPKPGYDPPSPNNNFIVTPECKMGEDLTACGANNTNNRLTRLDPPNPTVSPDEYGLDGYWERRARGQGLRAIVGQRLQLGNAFGWVRDANGDGDYTDNIFGEKNYSQDPLHPQEPGFAATSNKGRHEFRQQRTLRDNLSAVQATAVYHHTQNSGDTPVACVATTVHPGTARTLKNSATFETININGTPTIAPDFFSGRGTNGWEFEAPDPNGPVSRALTNLARFAGDPQGAFPPVQEGGMVHPNPQLTMWGDFSNLYRAQINGATSLADTTTKQTAACTLGMLAYNIDYLQRYDYTNAGNRTEIGNLADALANLSDGNNANGEIRVDGTNIQIFDSTGTEIGKVPNTTVLSPDAYIAALPPAQERLARLLHNKEQVNRDRQFGFKRSPNTPSVTQYRLSHLGGSAFTYAGQTYNNGNTINLGCDISNATGNNFFGFGAPANQADEQKFIRLAKTICSPQPEFPALYYIFPTANHTLKGTAGAVDDQDGLGEPYIDDPNVGTIVGNYTFQGFTPTEIAAIATTSEPKPVASWVLPKTPGATPNNAAAAPNDSTQELIKFIQANGTEQNIRVAIKDSAFYNGREHMNVRALNMDLDLLRQNEIGGESWLSDRGIVYAFREDAVREDAIARPGVAYNPDRRTGLPAVMNATGNNPTDPALDANGISPKPVDYYADPDRRPHGFRLKNGADLSREGTNRGLTFVSDQPVFTQGNFNLHGPENRIQEFNPTQADEFTNFYGRNTLNTAFAKPGTDPWRPTEILADAITILSDNFCDGSIEDGFVYSNAGNPDISTTTTYGCRNGVRYTSYVNQNRPNNTAGGATAITWQRENPVEATSEGSTNGHGKSPVLISRNGAPITKNTTATPPTTAPYAGNYFTFKSTPFAAGGRKLIDTPANTWVNMVMVNGVVPSRQGQGNGGFPTFPRMIENWRQRNLYFKGSFVQLNYSNYATAPFEHDAWEPGAVPVPGITTDYTNNGGGQENIFYYLAPNRRWGYDVGLQYMPPGAASSRMSQLSNERNEYYREPEADDPYICKLRAAIAPNFACNP